MKQIAIIPARGGSKRIPRKNIIEFDGKPMIVWSIEAALKSRCFNHVLVSTDSDEIAKVAIAAGASVPFLREENADDNSSSSMATISALKQAEVHWNIRYDRIVQLMPNCPLRNSEHIIAAMDNFHESNSQFQISCFRFGWMNPWWAVKLDVERVPTPLFPEAMSNRSQDLEHLYCPTGAIWVANRDDLLEAGTFYGPNHRYYPLSWMAAADIDDMDDLRFAQMLALFSKQVPT